MVGVALFAFGRVRIRVLLSVHVRRDDGRLRRRHPALRERAREGRRLDTSAPRAALPLRGRQASRLHHHHRRVRRDRYRRRLPRRVPRGRAFEGLGLRQRPWVAVSRRGRETGAKAQSVQGKAGGPRLRARAPGRDARVVCFRWAARNAAKAVRPAVQAFKAHVCLSLRAAIKPRRRRPRALQARLVRRQFEPSLLAQARRAQAPAASGFDGPREGGGQAQRPRFIPRLARPCDEARCVHLWQRVGRRGGARREPALCPAFKRPLYPL
mmetsp:Transcript_9238/g.30555  ORF Transcript_9238/g.30555 Transcript_9238/m.30555 type:complete len:268 (+) Transcript_9238:498-1301(+)